MRQPTRAQVAFELMLEGGTGHDAYGRLTEPLSRETRIDRPASAPSWIRTADGWRQLQADSRRPIRPENRSHFSGSDAGGAQE